MGEWKSFNYKEIKKFIIENLDIETKEFLMIKYPKCKKIDDIKHLNEGSLKQFYQALTLENGKFIYVKTSINNTTNLGGYLVKIKSRFNEQNEIDDGSNSSIIMCHEVEFVKQVSDNTRKFVYHRGNPTGFILNYSFNQMSEKQRDLFIKYEC
jgi:hypothetical protein